MLLAVPVAADLHRAVARASSPFRRLAAAFASSASGYASAHCRKNLPVSLDEQVELSPHLHVSLAVSALVLLHALPDVGHEVGVAGHPGFCFVYYEERSTMMFRCFPFYCSAHIFFPAPRTVYKHTTLTRKSCFLFSRCASLSVVEECVIK